MHRELDKDHIISLLASSDERGLKILHQTYYPYLRVVGSRYLKDKDRVEDVIQDAFYDIWIKRKSLKIKVNFKFYLRAIVIHKCLSIIRKEQRIVHLAQIDHDSNNHATTPEDHLNFIEIKKQINDIVDQLPNKCKQVFLLSRIEGKSHKDISAQLGISTKTIENHMTRALKSLRKGISDYLFIILFLFQLGDKHL